MEHAEILFENMVPMMKKLKKLSYENNMDGFLKQHGDFFKDMTEFVEQSDDKQKAAKDIAAEFTGQIKDAFSVNGKVNGRKQADMNFFMIYYVFPAILLRKSEYSKLIADSVRDSWRVTFKDCEKIDYADYQHIHDSFRNKIFGIF